MKSSKVSGRVFLGLVILGMVGGCLRPATDLDLLDRGIVGEVMMHSELAGNLRALCVPGGRLSGSPNGHQAEEYMAGKLREYGLRNVHLEPFEMTSWQDRSTTVTVLGDPPVVLEGALSLGNCLSTPPGGVTAGLVDVGKGTEEEFERVAEELPGKFALAREGGSHRSRKMSFALAGGAAGLVHVSRLEDRARVGQCHPEPRPEPGVVVTGADGAALAKRLEAGEDVTINVEIEAQVWDATPNNVVAEIPGVGSLADELVIIGGHLDSWHLAEGAIDNGNGSVAVLEAARALAAADWQPRRTVRFVWFMGEEHGLHGSRAYVKAHCDEMDRVVAMINVDMPGAPRSLYTFGHPELDPFLKSVQADLAGFEISPEIGNASWTASDHAAFMKQGVCALSLSGELGPGVKFYHSNGDMYDVVDRRGTTQAAAVLAILVRRLADEVPRPSERFDPVKLAEEMGWADE